MSAAEENIAQPCQPASHPSPQRSATARGWLARWRMTRFARSPPFMLSAFVLWFPDLTEIGDRGVFARRTQQTNTKHAHARSCHPVPQPLASSSVLSLLSTHSDSPSERSRSALPAGYQLNGGVRLGRSRALAALSTHSQLAGRWLPRPGREVEVMDAVRTNSEAGSLVV